MRGFAFAWAISCILAGPALAQAPARVASLKLCTDEMLLMLAAPEQIASLTHLAPRREETPLWRQALRFPHNDGSLLGVAALKPSLVVDMGGGARDTAKIAQRLGIRLLTLPYPRTLDDVTRSITMLAAALHRPEAGRRLVSRIETLKRTMPARQVDAVWLGGGGRSLASQGLGAEWMALAGLRQRALPGDRMTLEQMLVRPPVLLLESNYRRGQHSAEQKWLSHPLLQDRRRSRIESTDGRRWTCMGPVMIDEILRLRRLFGR